MSDQVTDAVSESVRMRMTIEARAPFGASISVACAEAVEVAKRTGCLVAFSFNGERLIADENEPATELETEWRERTARTRIPLGYHVDEKPPCRRCGASNEIDPRTGWCRGACRRG